MIGHSKGQAYTAPLRELVVESGKSDTVSTGNGGRYPMALPVGEFAGVCFALENTPDDWKFATYEVAADGTVTAGASMLLARNTAANQTAGKAAAALKNPRQAIVFWDALDAAGATVAAYNLLRTDTNQSEDLPTSVTLSGAGFDQSPLLLAISNFKALAFGTDAATILGLSGTVLWADQFSTSNIVGAVHPDSAKAEQDLEDSNDRAFTNGGLSGCVLEDNKALLALPSNSGAIDLSIVTVSGSDGATLTRTTNRSTPSELTNYVVYGTSVTKINSTTAMVAVLADYSAGTGTRAWLVPATISGTTVTLGTWLQFADETAGTLDSSVAEGHIAVEMFGTTDYGLVVFPSSDTVIKGALFKRSDTTVSVLDTQTLETVAAAARRAIPTSGGIAKFKGDMVIVPIFSDTQTLTFLPVRMTPPVSSTTSISDDTTIRLHDSLESSVASGALGNVDCGTGSNRLLLVAAWQRDGTTQGDAQIDTMTYNSVSMTKLLEIDSAISNYENLSVWYLLAPATGSNALAVTTVSTSNPAERRALALAFENVKQEAPSGGATEEENDVTVDFATSSINAASLALGFVGNDTEASNLWPKTVDAAKGLGVSDSSAEMQYFLSFSSDGTDITFDFTEEGSDSTPYLCAALGIRDDTN